MLACRVDLAHFLKMSLRQYMKDKKTFPFPEGSPHERFAIDMNNVESKKTGFPQLTSGKKQTGLRRFIDRDAFANWADLDPEDRRETLRGLRDDPNYRAPNPNQRHQPQAQQASKFLHDYRSEPNEHRRSSAVSYFGSRL